jgi:hypothetical protein
MEIVRSGAGISWPAPLGKVCGHSAIGPRSLELVLAGQFAPAIVIASPLAAQSPPASQNLATICFSATPANWK